MASKRVPVVFGTQRGYYEIKIVRLAKLKPADKLTAEQARKVMESLPEAAPTTVVWDREHQFGYRVYMHSEQKFGNSLVERKLPV